MNAPTGFIAQELTTFPAEESDETYARRQMAKADEEYTRLCTELGDLSLRQEELQLRIGAIRARVNQLRDEKKKAEKILAGCLRPPNKETRSAAEILESQMKCAEVPRE